MVRPYMNDFVEARRVVCGVWSVVIMLLVEDSHVYIWTWRNARLYRETMKYFYTIVIRFFVWDCQCPRYPHSSINTLIFITRKGKDNSDEKGVFLTVVLVYGINISDVSGNFLYQLSISLVWWETCFGF